MSVEVFYKETEILDLDPEFFVLWLGSVCSNHRKKLNVVTIIITNDDSLLEMNKRYLNHDYYTDILTFDNSVEGNEISGDLFISIERVLENARDNNVSRETELNRVIVHGVLHLIGFNDKNSEEASGMRNAENEALDLIVPRET